MFSIKSIYYLSFFDQSKNPQKCARSFGRAKIMNSNFYLLTTFCEILTHSFLFTFRNYMGVDLRTSMAEGTKSHGYIIQLLLCCIFLYISYPTFLCKPVSRIKLRIRVDCKSGVSYLVVSHVDYVDAFLEYVSNLLYVNSVF